MSRSYRKPYWTGGYGGKTRKLTKRQANRRVRKSNQIANGNDYRKIFNPWDICDWKFFGDVRECEKPWKVARK